MKEQPKMLINDTILSLIEEYFDIVISARLKEIREILLDRNEENLLHLFIKDLPNKEFKEFTETVSKYLDPNSNLAKTLMYLNMIMKLDEFDVLILNNEFFRDILNGRLCKKPEGDEEKLTLIHEVQEKLIEAFNNQVEVLGILEPAESGSQPAGMDTMN